MGNGALTTEKAFKAKLLSGNLSTSSSTSLLGNTKQNETDNFDDYCFEIYRLVSQIYEEQYRPLVRLGQMTEKEAFLAAKAKYEELLDNGVNKQEPPMFTKSNQSEFFDVGDVVKVFCGKDYCESREGVVIELIGSKNVKVDFGDDIETFAASNCHLVIRGDEFEIGDEVEVQVPNTALYCIGEIIAINPDTTLDIRMHGDDPDDIERNVRRLHTRKIMTKRKLAKERWRRVSWTVIASNKFLHQIQFKDNKIIHPEEEEEKNT